MRNVIKIVSSVSSAALLLSGVAMAAAPTGYVADTWTVNALGDVTSVCPAAAAAGCDLLAQGTGFKQEQFVLGGKTYIRTILAEGWTATGGATQAPGTMMFTDENLVQIGIGGVQAPQGLISRTRIVEDATPALGVTGFLTDASIATGWGTGTLPGEGDAGRKAEVKFVLNVSERPETTPPTTGAVGPNDFLSKFAFAGFTDNLNQNIGEAVDIDQTVRLNSISDKQRFVSTTKVAGTTRVAPATPGFKFAANTSIPAEYLTWTAGDRLQAIWIAQSVVGAGAGSSTEVSPFSTSVLRNMTDNKAVGLTSLLSTALAAEFTATTGPLVGSFGTVAPFTPPTF